MEFKRGRNWLRTDGQMAIHGDSKATEFEANEANLPLKSFLIAQAQATNNAFDFLLVQEDSWVLFRGWKNFLLQILITERYSPRVKLKS